MKKRSFSLLEVIIACSIIAMMTLFAIAQLKGFVLLENRLQKESQRVVDLSYFSLKIKLFLEQNYLSDFAFDDDPLPEVSFTFSTDPVTDPSVPEKMWGRLLYANNQLHMLYYASAPQSESISPPLKEELFFSEIERLDWSFYRFNEQTQQFDEIKQWDTKETSLPQIAKLTLFFPKEKAPHTTTFFLPAFRKLQFVM